MTGKFEAASILLSHGARLDLRNSRGKTAEEILVEMRTPISLDTLVSPRSSPLKFLGSEEDDTVDSLIQEAFWLPLICGKISLSVKVATELAIEFFLRCSSSHGRMILHPFSNWNWNHHAVEIVSHIGGEDHFKLCAELPIYLFPQKNPWTD